MPGVGVITRAWSPTEEVVIRVRLWTLLAASALAAVGILPADAGPKALLIGVGKYKLPNNDLPGIDLDIENMRHVAGLMGFAPGDVRVLLDEQASYVGVKTALTTWLRDGVGPDDRVLIYFSGHGTRVPDPRPSKAGEVDDALVLNDVRTAISGGRPTLANVLLGYEFGEALAANPSRRILVLVDACHSGTATRTLVLGNHRLGDASGAVKAFHWAGAPTGRARNLDVRLGDENYAAVSAARDDEYAVATEHGGLFTLGVVDTVDSASRDARRLTVSELRTAAGLYIERHTDEQSRHHPVADGNRQLVEGPIGLIALRGTNGPTWSMLSSLAGQGAVLKLTAPSNDLHLGDEISLVAEVPWSGFLNVVAVDAQDRATVLYPNRYSPSNEVVAGRFTFPTRDMSFVVRATEPAGPTLVVAFLSSRKVNFLDLGIEGRDDAGRMQAAFTEVTARATRALAVEARGAGFAAGTLTINVRR
jgi:hypothetical protein